ncbi:Zn-dependent protease with chaperone function [Arthrobacter sp. CAN_A214]|uniref:M48 family metalloprotease n=1 Tax=Arthrobacter sp. CAN_A214 TaxID=2787720 RepID=UPI0018CBA4FC
MEILNGAEQHPDTTNEEVHAFDRVREAVRQICADKDLSQARVHFVEEIGGLALNAQFRPHGGTPTIYVTHGAAIDLTPAALRWLLAHEIGHYWHDKRWRRTHLVFRILTALMVLVVLGLVIARITNPSYAIEILSSISPMLVLPLYLAFCFRKRADEARADDFAVLHEGDLIGAKQCLHAWDEVRPERLSPHPLIRKLRLMMQSHPWRYQRLASMTLTLQQSRPTI